MKHRIACLLGLNLCLLLGVDSLCCAATYRVEPLEEAASSAGLAPEISDLLSPVGSRIIRGKKTTYCDFWLLKSWSVKKGFQATAEVLYPFQTGQLVGVVRFSRKGADFRDQDIAKGVYTLRYALQPLDGSHIGTSPTRDFLLLVRAEDDQLAGSLAEDDLTTQSAQAAESSHPCMLSLQRVVSPATTTPGLRHNEEQDWWILSLEGELKAADVRSRQSIDMVIVGQASE